LKQQPQNHAGTGLPFLLDVCCCPIDDVTAPGLELEPAATTPVGETQELCFARKRLLPALARLDRDVRVYRCACCASHPHDEPWTPGPSGHQTQIERDLKIMACSRRSRGSGPITGRIEPGNSATAVLSLSAPDIRCTIHHCLRPAVCNNTIRCAPHTGTA
jgi:hypothetical protein